MKVIASALELLKVFCKPTPTPSIYDISESCAGATMVTTCPSDDQFIVASAEIARSPVFWVASEPSKIVTVMSAEPEESASGMLFNLNLNIGNTPIRSDEAKSWILDKSNGLTNGKRSAPSSASAESWCSFAIKPSI